MGSRSGDSRVREAPAEHDAWLAFTSTRLAPEAPPIQIARSNLPCRCGARLWKTRKSSHSRMPQLTCGANDH